MQSLNREENEQKNHRVLEVGTSNSLLSVGKFPQLLREQKFPKPTPRWTKTIREELSQTPKNLFSWWKRSPSIHTPVVIRKFCHQQKFISYKKQNFTRARKQKIFNTYVINVQWYDFWSKFITTRMQKYQFLHYTKLLHKKQNFTIKNCQQTHKALTTQKKYRCVFQRCQNWRNIQ